MRDEWVTQLNLYAHLYRAHGFKVKGLRIVAILRDWSETQALRAPGEYPQAPVVTIKLPLWSQDETEDYIKERIALHRRAEAGQQIDCTDEERWATARVWAVMKGANKRASKLCNNLPEAQDYIAGEDPKHKWSVVERPPQYKRCERYCPVAKFCPQWAATPRTVAAGEDD